MKKSYSDYSFKSKIREAIYKRKLTLSKKVHDPIFSLDKKSVAYDFAQNFNIKVPNIFYKNSRLEDIDIENFKESFVLKPEQSHSSLGVNLVHIVGGHGSRCLELLSNQTLELKDVRLKALEVMKNNKVPNRWMVEELVYPDDGGLYAIDDWKFYCFYGKVGLVLQKRKLLNGGVEFKLYDENMNEAKRTGKYVGRINSDLPVSKKIDELFVSAEKLSASIPKPFMRVDLFSSANGVYFGEFTPFPGGFSMFWKSWDQRLGKLWLDAEERLERDARSGVVFKLNEKILQSIRK